MFGTNLIAPYVAAAMRPHTPAPAPAAPAPAPHNTPADPAANPNDAPAARNARRTEGALAFLRRRAPPAAAPAGTELAVLAQRPAQSPATAAAAAAPPASAPVPTQEEQQPPTASAPKKEDRSAGMRRMLERTPQVDIDIGPKGETRTGNIASAVHAARLKPAAATPAKQKEHGVVGRHFGSVARSDAARDRLLKTPPGRAQGMVNASSAARAAMLKSLDRSAPMVQDRMLGARSGNAAFRQSMDQHLGASEATHELADALLQDHADLPAVGDAAPAPVPVPLESVLVAQALTEPTVHDAATGERRPPNGAEALAAAAYLTTEMNWNALTGPAPTDRPDAQLAWRAAEVLSRSDAGFGVLMDLMHKAPEAYKRDSLHTFLQAADQLRQQPRLAHNQHVTPHAMLQNAARMGNSPAGRALQASAAVLKDSAAPGFAHAMTSKESFTRLATAQLGESDATATLINKLLPATHGEAPDKLGSEVLLAHALTPPLVRDGAAPTLLTGGDALKALAYMTDTMDVSQLTTPARTRPPEAARAWQSAEVLSRTSHGFEVLMDKMAHPPPPGPTREAMRSFLQASDTLRNTPQRATVRPDEHPNAVMQLASTNTFGDTLASRTIRASADILSGAAPRNQARAEKAKGDLFAWRQGFRADGKGSTHAMLTGRLRKFVRTAVPRAETTGKTKALKNMAGISNSALTPLAKGVQGTHLANLPKELENYCGAFQDACGSLGDAVADMPAASPGLAADERAAVAGLLRQWAGMTPKPKTPDKFSCAALAGAPEGSALRELADKPVTLDLLTHLAKHIKLPAPAIENTLAGARAMEQAADLKPAAMTRDEMAALMNTLIGKMQSNSRLKLSDGAIKGISTAGASAIVSKALEGALMVGVRADLRYDYGRHTTMELARTGQGYEIFLGTTDNHRAQGGVGVKLGHDIKVGSKDAGVQTKVRVGAGATVTPVDYENSHGRGVIFRVERPVTDATRPNLDKEWASVAFDDARMIDTTQRLMGFLLDAGSSGMSEEGLWNKLAADFGEGVSVGWQDNKTTTNRQKLAIDFGAAASAKFGDVSLRAGASINLAAENTSGQHNTVSEVGGTGNLEQRKFGSAANVTTGVNIGLGMGTTVGASDPKANGSTGAVAAEAEKKSGTAISSGGLDLLNAQTVLAEQNQSVKVSLPTLDGKLISRSTYLDHEFVGVDAYVEKLEQQRELWVRTMTSVHVRDRGGAGVPKPEIGEAMFKAFTKADLAEGTRQFDALIATARAEAKPNFKYLVRMRMKPEAAEKYDHLSDIAKQAGSKFGQGDCEEQKRLLLADPQSWLPAKLATSEKISDKDTTGLKAGLRAFGVRQAEGARELRAFKCE
ncbi:hypothetical protein INH39_30300 [Massilia violaceinigra]|uniref:Awr type III effector family protein n=1 Tax=Massilia violaceinigra TaxID=2045208 RepID=A0ABY4A4C7_9BURK|nr:hemagglutinin repeat-containing protein [Massilia violaceinigra]UOD29629.1 hypothetical protein INH39_30300 [Massilia violaceinigra]